MLRSRAAAAAGLLICFGTRALLAADESRFSTPLTLSIEQQPESIYAPPEPPRPGQGVNEGAVHLDLTVRYMTDYVFRGIDFSEVGGREDAPNVQFDGALWMDLGKLPHPFVGLFINVYDSDPVSEFQEIRPTVGFDWTIKPLTFTFGNNTFIYPDRDPLNTNEVYTRVALDDSFLWGTTRPVFSPYAFAAYDYEVYNGWYMQAGVKHDFMVEDTGITLTLLADVSYVMGLQQYALPGTTTDDGFQRYELGAVATYSLNTLLNVSKRYGEFSFQGYMYYTDNIDHGLRADTQIWGGVGINFKY